jgi:hypothetical protein
MLSCGNYKYVLRYRLHLLLGITVPISTWNMHFHMVNKRQTNALNIHVLIYHHSPKCFGALKAPSSGSLVDPAEIVVQCHESGTGYE